MKKTHKIFIFLTLFIFLSKLAFAAPVNLTVPKVNISVDNTTNPKEYVDNIKLLLLLTSLSFIPSIILLMTSFTRIIIVFGFLRNALSTQQTPPNQVLIGLALFMTFFYNVSCI
ncbi:hypothetical protein TCEA9_14060 [Thermobrachium celere]|nr:hypothetical protein TCEA9_14060 [Thermobrachium celere]